MKNPLQIKHFSLAIFRLQNRRLWVQVLVPLPKKTTPEGVVFFVQGLERAAPVGTLVQKRAGGTFLARGRVHGTSTAAGTAVGTVPL